MLKKNHSGSIRITGWPQLNIRINLCWDIQVTLFFLIYPIPSMIKQMKYYIVHIYSLFLYPSHRKKPLDHDKVTGKLPWDLRLNYKWHPLMYLYYECIMLPILYMSIIQVMQTITLPFLMYSRAYFNCIWVQWLTSMSVISQEV